MFFLLFFLYFCIFLHVLNHHFAPSDVRADIECAFSNGQGSMVWDCIGFQALSKGRVENANTSIAASLLARWKTKHELYPKLYDTFAAFIMTLTGAICENTRKALLTFCRRACSRAIARDSRPRSTQSNRASYAASRLQ